MTAFLIDDAPGDKLLATLVMAHGAGAGPESATMAAFAAAAASAGLRVVRFAFAYAAGAGRRPPPRLPVLVPEFATALEAALARWPGPVIVGGKSMGSRVACRLADGPLDPRVVGVFALGFPFHPPGRPDKTRLDDLAAARPPVLICQGTRDPFGDRETVSGYALGQNVQVEWFEAAGHDLNPPKASGFTQAQHLSGAASALAAFANDLVDQAGGS